MENCLTIQTGPQAHMSAGQRALSWPSCGRRAHAHCCQTSSLRHLVSTDVNWCYVSSLLLPIPLHLTLLRHSSTPVAADECRTSSIICYHPRSPQRRHRATTRASPPTAASGRGLPPLEPPRAPHWLCAIDHSSDLSLLFPHRLSTVVMDSRAQWALNLPDPQNRSVAPSWYS
jgi:hypothetical protein